MQVTQQKRKVSNIVNHLTAKKEQLAQLCAKPPSVQNLIIWHDNPCLFTVPWHENCPISRRPLNPSLNNNLILVMSHDHNVFAPAPNLK